MRGSSVNAWLRYAAADDRHERFIQPKPDQPPSPRTVSVKQELSCQKALAFWCAELWQAANDRKAAREKAEEQR
jgi:hypothetical protein